MPMPVSLATSRSIRLRLSEIIRSWVDPRQRL